MIEWLGLSREFAFADVIDVASVLPSVLTTTDVNIRPGDGNDTVTGHAGKNFINAGGGVDTIDGGGGDDILGFDLTGIALAI